MRIISCFIAFILLIIVLLHLANILIYSKNVEYILAIIAVINMLFAFRKGN